MSQLTADHAAQFMALTLGHIDRPYPFKMDMVWNGPDDARPPAQHHPIFHGSFDWHSCVHGWWQLAFLARTFADLPLARQFAARADAMLVPDKVAGEIAFFDRPFGAGASRPYGWAWLLTLHAELARHDAGWAAALEPLARKLAQFFASYIARLTYPIRVGTHFNTAFACTLIHRWAMQHDPGLAADIASRAIDWFVPDHACQAWEPGGDEFLSPALCEALLLGRVLAAEDFADWFDRFLPGASRGEPQSLFTPAIVSDRSDGKIAHLDGLNLSRAWCWRAIAAELSPHPMEPVAAAAAQHHIAAALPHIAADYMGEHWLATYAVMALADDAV